MKTKPMTYKGYTASVDYDDESEVFYGRVIDINDVIDFHGASVAELKQAFADSVDAYLEFCEEFSKEPDKPYAGKILLRISPELHRKVSVFAHLNNTSTNDAITRAIEYMFAAPEKPDKEQIDNDENVMKNIFRLLTKTTALNNMIKYSLYFTHTALDSKKPIIGQVLPISKTMQLPLPEVVSSIVCTPEKQETHTESSRSYASDNISNWKPTERMH